MLAGATLCLVMGRIDGKLDFSAEKGRGRTVKLNVLKYHFKENICLLLKRYHLVVCFLWTQHGRRARTIRSIGLVETLQ